MEIRTARRSLNKVVIAPTTQMIHEMYFAWFQTVPKSPKYTPFQGSSHLELTWKNAELVLNVWNGRELLNVCLFILLLYIFLGSFPVAHLRWCNLAATNGMDTTNRKYLAVISWKPSLTLFARPLLAEWAHITKWFILFVAAADNRRRGCESREGKVPFWKKAKHLKCS